MLQSRFQFSPLPLVLALFMLIAGFALPISPTLVFIQITLAVAALWIMAPRVAAAAVLFALMAVCFAAMSHADTMKIGCTMPAACSDTTALSNCTPVSTEVYFGSATTPAATFPVGTCAYSYPIPAGACVKSGVTVTLRMVTATGGRSQPSFVTSDSTLAEDYCTAAKPPSVPSAPAGVKVSKG